jgi:DNA-binding NarL/FixJ family response regulator
LTDREFQVLDQLAAGLSTVAVAAHLGITGKTVSNQVSAVLAKLGVADRGQATVLAREAGLGRRPPTDPP